MTDINQNWDAELLERRFDTACAAERLEMRPEVERIVRTLAARGHAVPRRLHRIYKTCEQDAFDDMFNNMPV